MIMEFEDFLEKQNSIYSRIGEASLEETGIVPAIPDCQGSYTIVLRHSQETVERASEVSERVSEIIPSIVYDGSNLHTGIAAFGTSDEFDLEDRVLDELSKGVRDSLRDFSRPTIDYNGWTYNKNSLIARGIPDELFFYIVQQTERASKDNGIEVSPTWGAHITINRFLEEKGQEEISEFKRLIEQTPVLGETNPGRIDVGHFIFTPEGFDYETYESFTLP